MKKLLSFALVLFLVNQLFASPNVFQGYITDVTLSNNSEEWCWAITQDSDGFMIYSVNNGVVIYDGVSENNIQLPFSPDELRFDTVTNKIWACGGAYIAVIEQSGKGLYSPEIIEKYQDLIFMGIEVSDDRVYFFSDNKIITVNAETDVVVDEITSEEIIEHSFVFGDKVCVIVDYFLFSVEDGKLVEQVAVDMPVEVFEYTLNLDNEKVLLGSEGRKYYIFDGNQVSEYFFKPHDFFQNNYVLKAETLSVNEIVLSSLTGGVAVVNVNSGKIVRHVGYHNGLADDEIREIYVDRNNGIWATHNFGISRIDLGIEIENYSSFSGLRGKVLTSKRYNDGLYAGTSEGLFLLEEKKDFEEYTVSVRVSDRKIETEIPDNKTKEKKGRRRLQWLKRQSQNQPAERADKLGAESYRVAKVRKRKLVSVSHEFSHVEGIEDRVKQLIDFNGSLLVAGNSGLYVYENKSVTKVINNVYVNDLYIDVENSIAYCLTDNGLYSLYKKKDKWVAGLFIKTSGNYINSICKNGNGKWLLAYNNKVVRCKLNEQDFIQEKAMEIPGSYGKVFSLLNVNDSTFIFTGNSKYYLHGNGSLELFETYNDDTRVLNSQTGIVWIFSEQYTRVYSEFGWLSDMNFEYLSLFENIQNIIADSNDVWVVTDDNKVYNIKPQSTYLNKKQDLYIIAKFNDEVVSSQERTIELKHNRNSIKCKLSSPFYLNTEGVMFRHIITGLDNDWSDWYSNNELEIKYLPPGEYELKVMARNKLGVNSDVETLAISIAKPFSQTLLFYLLIVLLTLFIAFVVFRLWVAKLRRNNALLERKVKERTKTIEDQKEKIENQHHEITQSIQYAQRIQTAMLPHDEIIEAVLPDHFIFFKPRDIVSGDFYFFKHVGDKVVFVAADCTGHGVPGGFMSMLGISFLREITSQLKLPTNAAEVLNHLREKIKLTLGQTDENSIQKDGMDMSVCLIEPHKKEIHFSGAYNPLIMVRNNEVHVIKADRQPVAVYVKESDFTNELIEVQEGDVFYMFSDGFPDQIGGEKDKKYMTKNFKKLLLEIHKEPFSKQKVILEEEFNSWKGDKMQVDDVIVVGFQL